MHLSKESMVMYVTYSKEISIESIKILTEMQNEKIFYNFFKRLFSSLLDFIRRYVFGPKLFLKDIVLFDLEILP